MATRPETAGDLFARQHGAERQAPSQSFRQGHNVGLDAEMFIAKEFAGAPHARLHFIKDQ